jgi:release factor glutamine methyltransferase
VGSEATARLRPPAGEGCPEGTGNIPLARLLQSATARLQQAPGLDRREARLETRVLVAHALGVDHAWLIAHDRDALAAPQAAAIEALIARREGGEPVAHILGEKEFYGRPFQVTPDVLIPRPETELLVEAALARLPKEQPLHVLDLGTGSGCVAITLALEQPLARVVAVDRSPAALAIARNNALRLGAANVEFIRSDWYAGLGVKKFDMIVGNPPYIAAGDPHLRRGDLRFEPNSALAAGTDGLDAIRAILSGAAAHLEPGGWLLLEHGFDQGAEVAALLARNGFGHIRTLRDLAGLERTSLGRRSPGTG